MEQIEKSGKVSRGYMGVSLQPITQDMAPQFGLKEAKGAIVGDVTAEAPGAKAGLKSGDVITAIDGKKVDGPDDLTMEVISHTPGSTVSLDVIRDNKAMKVSVTLGQRPGGVDWDKPGHQNNNDNDNDNNSGSGASSARGISVENLTPDLAEQIGVPASTHGVVINDVDQSSPAADANLGRGVVITAVDRHPVANVQDFKRLMNAAQGKPVLLTINAGGATAFTVVQPK